jgi:NAD(P)-dependent dehydrogenase (short-subunit alcohol dehydrogenase family)
VPTILITGSTDGLGRYLAGRLVSEGAHVILHGRNAEKLRRVRGELGEDATDVVVADLADLRQVDAMATEVAERFDRVDTLVNNAGIGAGADQGVRQESADGIELRFAVNYLAGYHLTRRLVPLLTASAPANVVNVASVGQRAVDFADPMLTRRYDGFDAYMQSKLAQIMFTFDLAEELRDRDVTVNALHPATFMDTAMVREGRISPASTIEEGGEPTLRLVRNAERVTGRYFDQFTESRANAQAYDLKARRRLRELSDELVEKALRG